LTAHFEDTVSPLGPDVTIGAIALRMPAPWLADRLARRVDEQFEAGCSTKSTRCGRRAARRPFGGLAGRPWSTCAASGMKRQRVHLLPKRTGNIRGGS
jgi:hypothetical protein